MSSYVSQSPELSIELENGRFPRYIPGETIVGTVSRTAPGVAPEARVVVTLHGKCKSKIKIKQNQSVRRYESEFNCLSAPLEAQILLPDAPLHIPEGSAGMSWPFALTIPSIVKDIRQSHQKRYYYAPSSADGVATFPPPGTFSTFSESIMRNESFRASVEYYVQATIELSHQYKGRTRKMTHTVTAPFYLKTVNLGPPIDDFCLRQHRMTNSVVAYRLVPGVGELTFRQKTRQAFMSSSVPRLAFNLRVTLPHTLQVENPSLIPLSLSIEADHGSTSEIIHDVPQTITIKSFSLRLKPHTTVQAEKHTCFKSDEEITLIPPTAIGALDQEVSLTITPRAGSPERPHLDLGEILDFRLRKTGIRPSFRTYNVGRSYSLVWEVQVDVVGEELKLSHQHPVTVLAGSHELSESERAPQEDVPGYSKGAPPAYDD
ncbi:uncharacterized protein BJX67DRAFT_133137 [Aspergillus lucknowensis]|uniref:Arrestin-like N-terminal domain-containing protein n=1 Tax=Aspergillus lucknowensis TaxID=176173 RepID=A0ABR4LPY3_9EURO